MAGDLNDFFNGLQGRLFETASTNPADTVTNKVATAAGALQKDRLEYFSTPAPNAIQWGVGARFLDLDSLYHHTRQYQIIRDFFQLRCPLHSCNPQDEKSKDCWGKTKEELQAEVLLEYSQAHDEDVCPSCGSTRSELIADGLLTNYTQMHVVAGMRSGKTATAAIIGTYIEHRIITIGHRTPGGLSKYFQQLPKQPFEITFIASTDVQSADTIWAKFTGLRSSSPWMQEYIKWIMQLQIAQQTTDGQKPWEYEERGKYILNGALNIKLNSLNSNSGGIAGRTRLAAFIDELSRFENTDSARGADEAYRVLENSLRTIRSKVRDMPSINYMGTMVSISSPISDDDKAMRLLKEAPRIDGMYSGHYATWEFNPDHPRETFDSDFIKDPIGAMRDFGARPPTAASPLVVDPARFRELAIDASLRPTVNFRKLIHTDRTNREYVSAVVENADLVRNGERYICFDAGSSFDQFAGACAHGEWVTTPEGRSLVTVYDWVFRLIPEMKPKREVWFDFVIGSIERMTKYAMIGRVEFDRWNSVHLIQQIRDRGVLCEMKGTTPDMFNKFINDVTYSKVRMLPPLVEDMGREPIEMSPQTLAYYEIEHLERSPDLKKVYNPKKGQRRGYDSDDVATVVVHVNSMVQGSAISVGMGNGADVRLRRETAATQSWASGGRLWRPPASKRGW